MLEGGGTWWSVGVNSFKACLQAPQLMPCAGVVVWWWVVAAASLISLFGRGAGCSCEVTHPTPNLPQPLPSTQANCTAPSFVMITILLKER